MPITSKLDDEELMRRPSRRSNACTFSSSFCCYCIEERSAGPARVVVVVVPGMNAVLHVCRGCHTHRGRVERRRRRGERVVPREGDRVGR